MDQQARQSRMRGSTTEKGKTQERGISDENDNEIQESQSGIAAVDP